MPVTAHIRNKFGFSLKKNGAYIKTSRTNITKLVLHLPIRRQAAPTPGRDRAIFDIAMGQHDVAEIPFGLRPEIRVIIYSEEQARVRISRVGRQASPWHQRGRVPLFGGE